MIVEKTLKIRQRQKGMTLIELMISIVLGLLILAAATAMTVKSMVINTDTLMSGKLNQDLDSVIQVMVNDIRRAGYTGGVFSFVTDEGLNIVSNSCVLYAYDSNENGALDVDEKFGFKLVNSRVEMRTSCTTGSCATDCGTGTWAPLTDSSMIEITGLVFDSEDSKCLSLTHPDNVVEPGGLNTNKNNFWVTTSVTTQFPCLATVAQSGALTTFVPNSAETAYETGTFVLPAAKDRLVEFRQVNVLITGRLTNDVSMNKNQRVGINVRNHHVFTL